MSRLKVGLLLSAAFCAPLLLAPSPAAAGTFTLGFEGGLRSMSNSKRSEKAIFDGARGVGAGLGVAYDRSSRWRFSVDFRRISRDGERAVAADRDSEAFRLGHPLTLTMTESLASASFRFRRFGPVSPYIRGGLGLVWWNERSTIAGLVERANGTAALVEGRIGLDREIGRVRLGLAGGITFTPNAVGLGGISKVYEENDLGGLFLIVTLGFIHR